MRVDEWRFTVHIFLQGLVSGDARGLLIVNPNTEGGVGISARGLLIVNPNTEGGVGISARGLLIVNPNTEGGVGISAGLDLSFKLLAKHFTASLACDVDDVTRPDGSDPGTVQVILVILEDVGSRSATRPAHRVLENGLDGLREKWVKGLVKEQLDDGPWSDLVGRAGLVDGTEDGVSDGFHRIGKMVGEGSEDPSWLEVTGWLRRSPEA
jgi:hypothetical protein